MSSSVKERFEAKNIERFFEQVFALSPDENHVLALEVIDLCGELKTQFKNTFPETAVLIEHANKHLRPGSSHTLSDVFNSIANEKKLGIHFIPAFISSKLLLTSYNPDRFTQYKALSLVSVTRLSFIGTHESKVKALCDDVRLFSRGKRENMSAYMPDIEQLSFSALVSQFLHLVDEENDSSMPSSVRHQLQHYSRSYEACHDYKDGYTRTVSSTAFKKESHLSVAEPKNIDDGDDTELVEITQIQSSTRSKSNWQQEDDKGDVTRSISVVTISKPVNYATEVINARAVHARILRKEMALACDIAGLTNFEVASTLVYCLEQIRARNTSKNTAKVILMMLFTGTNLASNKGPVTQRNNLKKLVGFKRTHKIPSQKQRDELLNLIANVKQSFWLPLPTIITSHLTSFQFNDVTDADIKAFLSHINKTHNTNLTSTKLAAFLGNLLTHQNADPAITSLLTGAPLQTVPPLYYLGLESNDVLKVHERYLNFLSRLSGEPNIFTDFQEIPLNVKLGSPLTISTPLLQTLFSALYTQIKQCITLDIASIDTHNAITVYTQLVMMLASAYRPVSGWFGKKEHLYLPTGDYWISDKEQGGTDTSRVIILPKTARNILSEYFDYCEKMALIHGNKYLSLSQRYQHTLSSDEHLFFYRSEAGIDECTPTQYSHHIDAIFPLQPNWARHHVKSLLHRHNVDASIVYAWIGHQAQCKRAFHSYSTLNRKQLRTVSNILDTHLETLGIGDASWRN